MVNMIENKRLITKIDNYMLNESTKKVNLTENIQFILKNNFFSIDLTVSKNRSTPTINTNT